MSSNESLVWPEDRTHGAREKAGGLGCQADKFGLCSLRGGATEAKEKGRGVMRLNLCFLDLLKEHTGEREAGTYIKRLLYTGPQRAQPSVCGFPLR